MATTEVDAVWWTLSQVADRDQCSKQAVSKNVARLRGAGLEVETDPQGRVVRINVVDYDRKRGRYGDPSKTQKAPRASVTPGRAVGPDGSFRDSYEEALRQKTWHEAEAKRLHLEEQRGALVRAEAVVAAVEAAVATIVQVLDRLPNATDELAAAVAREGAHGLRVALRKESAKMREQIAAALGEAAAGQPREEVDSSDSAGVG